MVNAKEKALYLVFGVLTTIVNIVCYFVLADLFNFSYTMATIYAWILSVLFAFITNKFYVFNSKCNHLKILFKELTWFIFYRLLSLFIDLLLMFILIELIASNDLIAKVISNMVVVVFNYFASKTLIFKKTLNNS